MFESRPLKPLAGMRVVDLSWNLPGPLATLMLSDLGAEVVKVEPPQGDPLRAAPPVVAGASALFHCLNRGKRFVALDLRDPGDLERFHALLSGADGLVDGFRPDVLPRLGLDPEDLVARYPDLVVARISGYGVSGPYATRAGHDVNFVGLSGVLGAQDSANPLPVQVADVGGALIAVSAVLAALLDRARGRGRGRVLDLPLLDAALTFAMAPHAREAGGDRPVAGAGFLEGGLATYRLYRDADGRWVSVAALEPRFAAEVEARFGGVDAEPLAAGIASLPRARLFANDPVAPCVEPVLDLGEARAHPAVRSRSLFRPMTWDEGRIDLPVTVFARHDPVPEGPWARPPGADNSVFF